MTDKTKKIIAREGRILGILILVIIGLNLLNYFSTTKYDKYQTVLREKHHVETVHLNGRTWGGLWDYQIWKKYPDVMADVIDKDGNKCFIDRYYILHKTFTLSQLFDWENKKPVDFSEWRNEDELSPKEKKEMDEKRKEREEKEKPVRRLLGKMDNTRFVLDLSALLTLLTIITYFIYVVIRFIRFVLLLIRTKKLTKNNVTKFIKIAFSKDVLIRVILILGILYLCILLLRSCGFIRASSFGR